MKSHPKIWIRVGVLVTMLGLAAAAAALPLVFTESVLSAFLRILELVARLS